MFADGPTREGPRPIQAGRLSRFRSFELLLCRNRAARSFNPESGPVHRDAISRNTVCLKPCGSSRQCATTLCPKLRRMSSDAYRETVSGSVAHAPPSFSQFESTVELLYRSWSCEFMLLVPLLRPAAGLALPRPTIASGAGRHPVQQSADGDGGTITSQSKRHWPSDARQAVPLCVSSRSLR